MPDHDARPSPGSEPIGPGARRRKPADSGGTVGVVTGTPEHEVNLAVGLELRRALRRLGRCVVMTRERAGRGLGNVARARLGNRARAALVVRVHADGSPDPGRRGVSVLYPALHPRWTVDVLPESRVAARLVQAALVRELGAPDLGTVARGDLTGFNWSDVPTVLAEVGFLTSPHDDRLLARAAYRRRVAVALARGVERFLARPREGRPRLRSSSG